MSRIPLDTIRFRIDRLKVEVYRDREVAGKAAAQAAAECLRQLGSAQDSIGVIFATGASQLDMLRALVSLPGIPWNKIIGFHMDEYIGIEEHHPASFRRYLRENLISRVPMREFFEINGSTPDHVSVIREAGYLLDSCDHKMLPRLTLRNTSKSKRRSRKKPSESRISTGLFNKALASESLRNQVPR